MCSTKKFLSFWINCESSHQRRTTSSELEIAACCSAFYWSKQECIVNRKKNICAPYRMRHASGGGDRLCCGSGASGCWVYHIMDSLSDYRDRLHHCAGKLKVILHNSARAIFGSDEDESTDLDEPCNVALMEMGVILADRFMQSYEFGGLFEIKRHEQISCEIFHAHQPKFMRIGSLMFTCSKGGGLLFRVWNLPGKG